MKTVPWVNSSDFPHGSLLGRLADWLEGNPDLPSTSAGVPAVPLQPDQSLGRGRENLPPGQAGRWAAGELAWSSFPWFHLSSILSRAGLGFLRPGDFPAQACFSHSPAEGDAAGSSCGGPERQCAPGFASRQGLDEMVPRGLFLSCSLGGLHICSDS